MQSLLAEMIDRDCLARYPNPPYQSLQASSYNRESIRRDKPGWFADSDGVGFIREESLGGKKEWVIMEHVGPGAITKMWTPFFYYDFNNRVGPNVRIYLDGSTKPVLDESLIKLVRGEGSIPNPFAQTTARAGDSYLPIPFAKSVKVTMTDRPFYNIVSYRAYPSGTRVKSFSPPPDYTKLPFPSRLGSASMGMLHTFGSYRVIPAGGSEETPLPSGPHAIEKLYVRISGDERSRREALRSTVISVTFDGEETIYCPIGDFFSSVEEWHRVMTFSRGSSTIDHIQACEWVMPYRSNAKVRISNFGKVGIQVDVKVRTKPWKWDANSMHFYARWRPDDIVAGTPFQDWNFVDIRGKGVYVGDSFIVLNIKKDTWWGEGDEKVYVDDDWDKGFPRIFGTGTEDYYGWAGGVLPTKDDEFFHPFLNNVSVGGLDGHTQGYNICTRERGLDAIPFTKRLRFDMESSFGVDMRNKWDLLGYSAVTFFYALPGATHNRPALPESASKPIMSVDQITKMSYQIRTSKD